jgi:hypothetical protein
MLCCSVCWLLGWYCCERGSGGRSMVLCREKEWRRMKMENGKDCDPFYNTVVLSYFVEQNGSSFDLIGRKLG